MRRLKATIEPTGTLTPAEAPSPATSAGSCSATASSTPASTATTRASSAWSPRSPPTSTQTPTARGSPRSTGNGSGAILCVHEDEHDGQAAHAARRAEGARPRRRRHARRRGHPPRPPARLPHAHALDQRQPAPRAPHLRARRLHARPSPSRERSFGARPRRPDLVAYPQAMNRDELRALQAPLKSRYKDDPTEAFITLKAKGTRRRRRLLQRRDRPRDRPGRPAPAHGRRRQPAVLAATCCSRRSSPARASRCRRSPRRSRSRSPTASVYAEGDLDFRGTLGVDKEAPVGFSDIRLRVRARHAAPTTSSSPRCSS